MDAADEPEIRGQNINSEIIYFSRLGRQAIIIIKIVWPTVTGSRGYSYFNFPPEYSIHCTIKLRIRAHVTRWVATFPLLMSIGSANLTPG